MSKQILIADTSELYRKNVLSVIDEIGNFDVIESSSLNESLSAIKSNENMLLIVMDISLPNEEDGLKLLSYIRRNSSTVNTPVIVISRFDSQDYIVAALRHSVKDYIIKPYQTERLGKSIKSILIPKRKFKYSVNGTISIVMPIEEYISKELKISSRTKNPLSIILLSALPYKEDTPERKEFLNDLSKSVFSILNDREKLPLRTTDNILLNSNGDILILLPYTDSPNANLFCDKILKLIKEELGPLHLSFEENFYSSFVTYPHDGNSFQMLMKNAFEKIESKKELERALTESKQELEKATLSLSEKIALANQKYLQYKK